MTTKTLSSAALDVLTTPDPREKAAKTRAYAHAWRNGEIPETGHTDLPDRPARPENPELLHPAEMPKRAKAGSRKSKVALLHALAHIELNAIDLAWDVMARKFDLGGYALPKAFYDDWIKVADDEAKHHMMLEERLNDLGATYGDLPAHDGLWEASEQTANDFAARLAIVPMVLEARGLDVTPNMIKIMKAQDDHKTAEILQIIHDDEITHVRAGTVWFEGWCDYHGKDVEDTWQDLVRTYFRGPLKRPFNHPSREEAGMIRDWYEPLADEE
ncbi:MAG: ferritin-like domain-containing protein [Alphaproteobacteria bacterium]|nr:ferritin-like domain-containing protein [Alphaproteobacteria bacterium]